MLKKCKSRYRDRIYSGSQWESSTWLGGPIHSRWPPWLWLPWSTPKRSRAVRPTPWCSSSPPSPSSSPSSWWSSQLSTPISCSTRNNTIGRIIRSGSSWNMATNSKCWYQGFFFSDEKDFPIGLLVNVPEKLFTSLTSSVTMTVWRTSRSYISKHKVWNCTQPSLMT